MIHLYGRPDPPIPRLVAALAARGHRLLAGDVREPGERSTLVLGASGALDPLATGVLLGAWRKAPHARVLVVSALGVHPDARAPRLRALWQLEELVRATRLPSLVLRLAPLVGTDSPLWRRLRARPRLRGFAHASVQPVAESDAVETLHRALEEPAGWEGWYEVAGREVLSLGALAELAAAGGPPLRAGEGEWEPPLAEIAEHRIAESGPWEARFGIVPRPLAEQAGAWAG